MLPRSLLLAIMLAPMLATAAAGQAQEDVCNAVIIPTFQNAGDIAYLTGPFLFRCTSGAELRADSGTANRITGELVLIGNVSFHDAERDLTAQQATYTRPIRRMYATGNAVFTNAAEGMTIRGPELEYFAVMPGRPEAQVNASNRPHLTIKPKKGAKSDAPLDVDADRMTVLGKNDLSAYGSVVIKRPDLQATAAEARYDGDKESLELRQNAEVHGKDSVLRGEVIQAQLSGGKLQTVHSRTRAELQSKGLKVTAPDVQLFFQEELVSRTVARGDTSAASSRPVAVTPTFRLVADSIDAVAPRQALERVTAIGHARGETIDTARAHTATPAPAKSPADTLAGGAAAKSLLDSDWIIGDTIIGYFLQRDSAQRAAAAAAARDTSVQLERLVARGSAHSLYRLEATDTAKAAAAPGAPAAAAPGPDSAPAKRGLNFVSADVITLRMADGKVQGAELVGAGRGVYADPAPPGSAKTPAAGTPSPAGAPAAGAPAAGGRE
jgi:lipopolysaccharide export system protein LptA